MKLSIMTLALAVIVAFCTVGCLVPSRPAPVPTATADIAAMVMAAIDAALHGTATPTPLPVPVPTTTPTLHPTDTPFIATPPPTPTPAPRRLQAVDCNPPDCISDYEPPWDYIDWMIRPWISTDGILGFTARIDDRVKLVVPGRQGRGNITLTGSSVPVAGGTSTLYGSILPPSGPGWHWTPKPGLWIAEQYTFTNNTLRVRAQIDPAAATHPGLRLCLWSGGSGSDQSLLDCVRVKQP